MNRILLVLLTLAASIANGAPIVNTLPYNLTNGTPTDATQVMANYNQIVNDVNSNAAHAGANSDITSLTGLTTALSVSRGGTGATTVADVRTALAIPSTSGVGATGTWGINITGNAATATSATSAGSATNATNATNCTNATNATTASNSNALGGSAAANWALLASPALTGVPTAPTAAAGTNTTQIATTAFAQSGEIGVGQTWQDMTASRAIGVTYTNSTGKPIMIVPTLISTGANYFILTIGGVVVGRQQIVTAHYNSLSAVVPNGATYGVTLDTSTASVQIWSELR